MKNILTSLVLVLSSLFSFGQASVITFGDIIEYGTNQPVANLSYTITIVDSNNTIVHSASTDNWGNFYDTIQLSSFGIGNFPVTLEFMDCDSTIFSQTFYTTPSNPFVPFDSVLYCISGGCDASFTTTITGDTLVEHAIINPVPGSTYDWVLSNGTIYGGTNVSHVIDNILNPGTYVMCVTQTDTLANCTVTECDTFIISPPATVNCDPTFTTSVVSDTSVTHTVSNVTPGTWYTWHLPNGNTVSGTSVNYTMNAYDSAYVACLVVMDTSANCTDSLCMTFAAGIIPVPPVNGISGTVSTASGTPAGAAMVYLIDLINDSSGIILVAVDSTTTVQGTYSFTNIPLGNYFVKASLLSSDPSYNSYLPSYFANSTNGLGALHWTNAATVSVPQTGMVSVSFNLVQGTNPGGPGFVGGYVSQGANKTAAEGDAVSGVLVILLDENDNPVAYTLSNAQGEFEFDNIAFGTYTVYAEVPGIPTTPGTVTLSAEKPNTNQILIEVNSSYVFTYVNSTTGFNDLSEVIFDVYPNPMRDEVTIVSSTDEAGKSALVEIYDINGKSVLRENISLAGTNKINTAEISSGYYLMQIQTQTNTTTIRLVK